MITFQQYLKELGFDLKRYESLNQLSDFDLISQLKARDEFSKYVKGLVREDLNCFAGYILGDDYDALHDSLLNNEDVTEAVSEKIRIAHYEVTKHFMDCFDNPIVNTGDERHLSLVKLEAVYSGHTPHMMSYSDVVHPLSRMSLESFLFDKATVGAGAGEEVMLTQEMIEKLDEEDNEKLSLLSSESISAIATESMNSAFNAEDFGYPMYLSLDIMKNDNDILEDLARLLPIWRSELKLAAPERKRSWEYIRGKIIGYKIFPLIDLLEVAKVYTHYTKKRVPKRIISLVLYPDGERDGFGMEQTVMPFLEKIRGKSYKLLTEYKINKE